MPADTDTAALVIDNCEPSLACVLFKVREAIHTGGDITAAVRLYLTTDAPEDMRTFGDRADRENALLLRESIRGATDGDWSELGNHYGRKHAEGQRQRGALPEKYRREWDKN